MSSLSRSGTWKLKSPKLDSTSMPPVSAVTSNKGESPLIDNTRPDSSDLLARRYDKYITLIKNLERFADNYLGVVSANVKHQEKVKKNLYNDVSPQFESNPNSDIPVSGSVAVSSKASIISDGEDKDSGINAFLEFLRTTVENNHSDSLQIENTIKNQILPEFKKLENEVHSRKKEYLSLATKEKKEVKNLQEKTSKELAKLSSATSEYDSAKDVHKFDYNVDPYLLKRSIMYSADQQIQKENSFLDFLESNEMTLKILETQILEILKKIFNNFTNILCNFYGSKVNDFTQLNDKLAAIPNDLEWKVFSEKNKDLLVSTGSTNAAVENQLAGSLDKLSLDNLAKPVYQPSANIHKRTIDDVTFANKDHQATAPILEGLLLKREGRISKKYNSYYYVITRTRYLYEFGSRSTKDNKSPSLILYLPDCLLGNPSSPNDGKCKIVLQGKDATNLIKTKKRYSFKASNYEEMMLWYNVLAEVSGLMASNQELRAASLVKSDDELETDDEEVANAQL